MVRERLGVVVEFAVDQLLICILIVRDVLNGILCRLRKFTIQGQL